jgi:phosphatidate cytidylyltransferase
LKNLVTRTLAGAVLVALIMGSIWWHPIAIFVVFFAFNAMALFEFTRMFQQKGNTLSSSSVIFAGSAVYIIVGGIANSWILPEALWSLLPISFLLFIASLYKNSSNIFEDLGIKLMSLLYIALPFGLFNVVGNMGFKGDFSPEPLLLTGFFILIWASDTFAYLFGMSFGKHRLFERISPKKSWEGSIGGAISTMIIAYFYGYYTEILNPWIWVIIGLFMVITATYGDLVESLLKRQVGVKDSGNIMPGHGGILDRFDAAIFSIPFYVFLLYLLA